MQSNTREVYEGYNIQFSFQAVDFGGLRVWGCQTVLSLCVIQLNITTNFILQNHHKVESTQKLNVEVFANCCIRLH